MKFIDTNAWCGSWPFAPIQGKSVVHPTLPRVGYEIHESLVSCFDTLFQIDPMPGNRSLFDAFRILKAFIPLPVINLATPAWEDHLDELIEHPSNVGIRLLPSYHGYRLTSFPVRRLVERLNEHSLRLVVTARLVDERHEHPAVTIKPVQVTELEKFLNDYPRLDPLIQGLGVHELKTLSAVNGRFRTDTSFAEWEDTMKVLKRDLPTSRILFGSLSPLQVQQAQIDKVRLSSISEAQRIAIACGNAQTYFGLQ
jgi:uncharacterized protein